MTVSANERFAVRRPLRDTGRPEIKGFQSPPMTFLSAQQIPEANAYVELAWINGIPEPAPIAGERVLDYDQFLLHIGMDHTKPQVLGGTVELTLGGQPIVFNTTTSVFIPKGTPYGPLTWKEFQPAPSAALHRARAAATPMPPRAGGERRRRRRLGRAVRRAQGLRLRAVRGPEPHARSGPRLRGGPAEPHHDLHEPHPDSPTVNSYLEFGWIWDSSRAAHPQDAARRLRRDRVAHRQRPRRSGGSGRRPCSSASATNCSSSTPPTAHTSPGGWTTAR